MKSNLLKFSLLLTLMSASLLGITSPAYAACTKKPDPANIQIKYSAIGTPPVVSFSPAKTGDPATSIMARYYFSRKTDNTLGAPTTLFDWKSVDPNKSEVWDVASNAPLFTPDQINFYVYTANACEGGLGALATVRIPYFLHLIGGQEVQKVLGPEFFRSDLSKPETLSPPSIIRISSDFNSYDADVNQRAIAITSKSPNICIVEPSIEPKYGYRLTPVVMGECKIHMESANPNVIASFDTSIIIKKAVAYHVLEFQGYDRNYAVPGDLLTVYVSDNAGSALASFAPSATVHSQTPSICKPAGKKKFFGGNVNLIKFTKVGICKITMKSSENLWFLARTSTSSIEVRAGKVKKAMSGDGCASYSNGFLQYANMEPLGGGALGASDSCPKGFRGFWMGHEDIAFKFG